jgi:hypothetical protein
MVLASGYGTIAFDKTQHIHGFQQCLLAIKEQKELP